MALRVLTLFCIGVSRQQRPKHHTRNPLQKPQECITVEGQKLRRDTLLIFGPDRPAFRQNSLACNLPVVFVCVQRLAMANGGLDEFGECVGKTAACVVPVYMGMFMQENRKRASEIPSEHRCRKEHVDALIPSAGFERAQNRLSLCDAVANVPSPEILCEDGIKIPEGSIQDI